MAGFSFGGGAAPASTGFSFESAAPNDAESVTAKSSTSKAPSSSSNASITIPSFESSFPFLSTHNRLARILSRLSSENDKTAATLEGQELLHLLSTSRGDSKAIGHLLAKPLSVHKSSEREASLQQLSSVRIILPNGNVLSDGLSPAVVARIQILSTELQIDDLLQCVSLYAAASETNTQSYFHTSGSTTFVERAVQTAKRNRCYTFTRNEDDDQVVNMARELYFQNQTAVLNCVLMLCKHRYQASLSRREQQNGANWIILATDQLLNSDLISNLINLVRELSVQNSRLAERICNALSASASRNADRHHHIATQNGTWNGMHQQQHVGIEITDVDHAILESTYQQRQLAAECLFYLIYHTQCSTQEVGALIDLIRDLTNGVEEGTAEKGLPILDCLRDVPDFYRVKNSGANLNEEGGLEWNSDHLMQQQQELTIKQPHEWYNELTYSLWSVSGLRQTPAATIDRYDVNGLRSSGKWNGRTSNIGGGKPQLLQCVSTLVLTVWCALDVQNHLLDRSLHGPNSFGMGNALFPPASASNGALSATHDFDAIHCRLDPNRDGYATWKRKDILGLLSAAYALMLRPAITLPSSPGGCFTTTNLSHSLSFHQHRHGIDIKSTFRSCLAIATIDKSLTFARQSLLPCLGSGSLKPTSYALTTDYAFYMSVLSNFTSQYMDSICAFGELPISRAQWLSDEEKELQVRRVQENHRRQFGIWSGQTQREEANVPKEVDITKRPDCIDDVIALAVAICTSCPDCAGQFWSTVELDTKSDSKLDDGESNNCDDDSENAIFSTALQLSPSRFLKKMERLQADDSSLLPAYASFLAAIALANVLDDQVENNLDGAGAVHSWLSDVERATSSSPNSLPETLCRMTWLSLLDAIRWYADELRPPDNSNAPFASQGFTDNSRRSSTSTEMYEPADSTSYYYGADGYGNVSGKGYWDGHSQQQSVGGSLSSLAGPKARKELGESNTYILLSFLGLISHVAAKSEKARGDILSIRLSAQRKTRSIDSSEDDALTILFSLLTTPIAPKIKGLAFVAIANLVRYDIIESLTEEEMSKVAEPGRKAWELLEACQIIPIAPLSQYAPFQDDSTSSAFGYTPSMFIARNQIASVNTEPSCWFPPSDQYGMIYEMEHVEAKAGVYPSTEGLMYLLTALISTVGCSSTLGSDWRPRPGCAPYIEFVVDFVLPRAMESKHGHAGLYFANPADECRLVTRALEVVAALLTRYVIPLPTKIPSLQQGPEQLTPTLTTLSGPANQRETFQQETSDSLHDIRTHPHAIIQSSLEVSGLALVSSDIFLVEAVNTQNTSERLRDFRDEQIRASPPSQIRRDYVVGGETGFDQYSHQSVGTNLHQSTNDLTSRSSVKELVPRAKSPGFSLLSEVLSFGGSDLFNILTHILLQSDNARGIRTNYGETVYAKALVMALFGNIAPIYDGSKDGRDHVMQQSLRHDELNIGSMPPAFISLMVQPLYPPTAHFLFDVHNGTASRSVASSDDGVLWRERAIVLSLRILCAAAAREDAFSGMLNAATTSVNVVPVLRLRPLAGSSMLNRGLIVKVVALSKLSNLLIEASPTHLIPVLAQYVGYTTQSLKHEDELSAVAMGLVSYICHTVSHIQSVHALCGRADDGQAKLASAFASRLSTVTSSMKEGVQSVILKLILSNLTRDTVCDQNLSHVLLGLSGKSIELQKKFLQQTQTCQKATGDPISYYNCLDAVLNMISDLAFILDPETSSRAAMCYEIVYRLCAIKITDSVSISEQWIAKVCVVSKLRRREFWRQQVAKLLDSTPLTTSLLQVIVARSSLNADEDIGSSFIIARDNDIMHCIAWLLKGVSIELYLLMGMDTPAGLVENSNNINQSELTAPQPAQCQRLLQLLFDGPESVAIQTLMDLPLHKPSISRQLAVAAPSRELIDSVSKTMDGPNDICGAYEVIDTDAMLNYMRKANTSSTSALSEQQKAALAWANSWNSYVGYTCASSHLAQAWGGMIGSVTVCCKSLLFRNDSDKLAKIFDQHTVVDLLTRLLSRFNFSNEKLGMLCCSSRNGADLSFHRNLNDNRDDSDYSIEAGSAFPLSIASLSLVGLMLDLNAASELVSVSHNDFSLDKMGSVNYFFGGDDLVSMASLFAGVIGSCGMKEFGENTQMDSCIAVLSVALTGILNSKQIKNGINDFYSSNAAVKFATNAVNAAVCLSKLAGRPPNNSETVYENNFSTVSLAARSGLSSLVAYFDVLENNTTESTSVCDPDFLHQVFYPVNKMRSLGSVHLSRLVELLATLDPNVAFTLTDIASCLHGTSLLVNAGASAALILAANAYLKNEAQLNVSDLGPGNDIIEQETYGSVRIEAPTFLLGHVSLLNVMLASSTSQNTHHHRLTTDTVQFIRIYSSTWERLIRSYPRDADLVTRFVTCFYLASSAVNNLKSTSDSGNVRLAKSNAISNYGRGETQSSTVIDASTTRLEHRVMDLAFHIAEYPFPSETLPSLPLKLRQAHEKRLTQARHVKIEMNDGRCWWNLIDQEGITKSTAPDGNTTWPVGEEMPLPDPPTGSINVNRRKRGVNDKMEKLNRYNWTEVKYLHAFSAAKCLRTCLMFLKCQANASDIGLRLDGLLLSKGLCRCADADRAIQDRLNFVYNETELAGMMDVSTMMDDSKENVSSTFQTQRVEQRSLQQLGPIIRHCTELLVDLSLIHFYSLVNEIRTTRSGTKPFKETRLAMNEFSEMMQLTLEHTQIETTGLGSVNKTNTVITDNEFVKISAKILREGLSCFSS